MAVWSWGLSAAEQDEVWARWRRGESLRLIARRLGKRGPSVRAFVLQTGGVQQPRRIVSCGVSAIGQREEISRGVAAGVSCRHIAAQLERAPLDGVAGAGSQRWPTPPSAQVADAAAPSGLSSRSQQPGAPARPTRRLPRRRGNRSSAASMSERIWIGTAADEAHCVIHTYAPNDADRATAGRRAECGKSWTE
jgi:hypothetical protein